MTVFAEPRNILKINVLAMNVHNLIRVRDGSQMRHAEEVTYLGGVLTKQVNIASKISNRIASAMTTWKSLDIFWKEEQRSLKSNILMYNAVIKSKLLYALLWRPWRFQLVFFPAWKHVN